MSMSSQMTLVYREATARDSEAIAALHADSWRRHYRGSYSDAFLDSDVDADRLAVWTNRLPKTGRPTANRFTVVAESGGDIVGFGHTILNHDQTWGALLDNLHVTHELKGQAIGTQLMAELARRVLERTPSSGLYLWVLEGNQAAQAFYESRGGKCIESAASEPPGGGRVVALRYVWPDPSSLLTTTNAKGG